MNLAALNERFAIPGKAEIIPASGGLPAVRITTPQADGLMYLHGAHVASWTSQQSPQRKQGNTNHSPLSEQGNALWLSEKSLWQPDKPIRGGVPICFPWFGANADNPAAPAHGFARLRAWQLESVTESNAGITVTLSLAGDADTKALWPHDFILRHRVTFGTDLKMALEFTNTGTAPATFEEAQHTYLAVGDVRTIKIRGLAGVTYLDKTDNLQQKQQTGDITITAETDRPYLNTAAPILLEDPSKSRSITVTKEGSRSTVVWNPWIAKAKAMPDFGDDEWPRMICIETANVNPSPVIAQPGETHIMTTWLRVQSL